MCTWFWDLSAVSIVTAALSIGKVRVIVFEMLLIACSFILTRVPRLPLSNNVKPPMYGNSSVSSNWCTNINAILPDRPWEADLFNDVSQMCAYWLYSKTITKSWVFTARALELWVTIPFEARTFVQVFCIAMSFVDEGLATGRSSV